MNPKIEVSITRTFTAEHSLPRVGVAQVHRHAYTLECGYAAEVDPELGCTRAMQDMAGEIDAIVARLADRNLNDVLPVTPTAEMLACWVLAELPDTWAWASVRAYEGFMCRVERALARPFIERLRANAPRPASS